MTVHLNFKKLGFSMIIFLDWMKQEWNDNVGLLAALKEFSEKLRAWNNDTFGNVFQRKRRNELRLAGVQKALAQNINPSLLNLEATLRKERRNILLQEELLWLQKFRTEWLKSGDDNTKYFHTATLIRRRRNKVEALLNEEGGWVDDKEQLKNIMVTLYSKLFSSERVGAVAYPTGRFSHVSGEILQTLAKDVSITETQKALMQMGSRKAPGPDGFHAGFYKRSWETSGVSLFNFAHGIFNGAEIDSETAEGLLVLVPKVFKPSVIANFRPTALCNVCVKLVSKLIANRLKTILSELVTANQASFVSGRQSMDTIIICQELIRSLRYTKARRGGMIVKLDMEKAYDRMEWSFVKETLRDAGLPPKLVSVIISLIQLSKS